MTNRNDPCPCGSGKKYKKCCMGKPGGDAAARAPAKSTTSAGGAGTSPVGASAGAAALVARALDAQRRGRFDEAERAYRQALERRPRDTAALAGLGQVCGYLGRHPEAIELMRRALALDGKRVDHLIMLGALLQLDGRGDEAIRAAERAVKLEPRNAAAQGLLASCYERRNRYDEAMTTVRRALALDPGNANASILLAGLLRRTGDLDGSQARLEAVLGRATLDHSLRQEALHEVALTLERREDYDAAYDAYTRCNEATSRDPIAGRTDAELWHRRLRDYRAGITPALITRWKRDEPLDDLPTPAFLVGFSRAGTTLTEQVMAAHPQIVTSNERPLIRNVKGLLFRMTGGGDDVPRALATLDDDGMRALRRSFWDDAHRYAEDDIEGRIFVHKQPMNTIDIGLINTLFPDARVVVALRDPRDVCLSCFQQLFVINTMNVNFLTLEGTVQFYADVMSFWLHVRDMLTVDWMTVRYEDTVRDLESQARRILELLRLPWDDDVLRFHERARDRAIMTPSYAAVARPVTTKSIGRWRNYATQFEPLLPVLAPYVKAFGYGESD